MSTYEVVLDNSRMLANCFEEAPPIVGPFELTLIPTNGQIEGASSKSHNPMVVASDTVGSGTSSATVWTDSSDSSYIWNDWLWSSKGVYPLWTTVDPATDPTWITAVGHTIDPSWVYQIGVKFRAKGVAGEYFVVQLFGNVSKLLSDPHQGSVDALTFAATDTWEDFEYIISDAEYSPGWAPAGMASALAISSYLYARTVPVADITGYLGDNHYIQVAEQRVVLYYDI